MLSSSKHEKVVSLVLSQFDTNSDNRKEFFGKIKRQSGIIDLLIFPGNRGESPENPGAAREQGTVVRLTPNPPTREGFSPPGDRVLLAEKQLHFLRFLQVHRAYCRMRGEIQS